MQASKAETKPVWVYVIFRKNHCSGHEKMTVNLSFDGPIFWNRQVAYIYCCSCHFDEHEVGLSVSFSFKVSARFRGVNAPWGHMQHKALEREPFSGSVLPGASDGYSKAVRLCLTA